MSGAQAPASPPARALAVPSSPRGLRRLDVTRSGITALDALRTCVDLEWLDVGCNALSPLPSDAFAGLKNLTILYLDNNLLSTVPKSILTDLKALEYLSMHDNQLSSLPELDPNNLPNITYAGFECNKITDGTGDIFPNSGGCVKDEQKEDPTGN